MMEGMARASWLSAALTIAAAAVVGASVWSAGQPPWAAIAATAVLACWVVAAALLRGGRSRAGIVLAVLAVLAGAALVGSTAGLTTVPVAVCLLLLLARDDVPLGWGLGITAGAVGLTCAGVLLARERFSVAGLVAVLFGLALGALAGVNRRAARAAEREAEAARERDAQARDTEARMRLAGDLHDVLAHSLGGLGLQLDAASALLDAGRVDDARERVDGAAALARDGLAEARKAVAALRSPSDSAAPSDPSDEIARLVEVHRALGAAATAETAGRAREVAAAVATALVRAVQEGLSNARRHAPGATAAVVVAWEDHSVRLELSTPFEGASAQRGGGFGLASMRQRFAALPGGSARAGVEGGRFVVRAEAAL